MRLPKLAARMDDVSRRDFLLGSARGLFGLSMAPLAPVALWGREDPIAVSAIAQRLAEENQRAELTWLDDVGHYPQLEAPDRVAGVLLETIPG